jgi:pyruvate dehydrogenase E1 component
MIPFYTFYSMFGLQRVGDLAWAAGDMRARGFLLGGTAGRTTLNGEGLQHEDGHSHVLASTIPNCLSYDPTFAHEVAVIMHDGLRRMIENQEDVFYYITLMNENYSHPGLKPGQEEGILKGLYLLQEGGKDSKHRVQLMGSGTILREVIAAGELLRNDWGIESDVWSAPSFTLLARDGAAAERWNMLHPSEPAQVAHITACLAPTAGPIVVSTDYMRTFAEQVRAYIPKGRSYKVLGTDGFGRSDTRAKLREFFEVNRHFVVIAALKALVDEGTLSAGVVTQAIEKYGINPNKPNPVLV